MNQNPSKAKFITDDITRFWIAYDKAYQDTLQFEKIFREEYFEKASEGMNDYMGIKVSSIDNFIKHVKSAPNFYKSIRKATVNVGKHEKGLYEFF